MDLQFQGEEISHAQGPDIDEDRVPDFDDPNYDPYPACYDYTLYKTADSVKSCNYVLYIIMYISDVMFDENPSEVETYQSLEELRENFLKRDNDEKKEGQSFTKWQEKLLTEAGISTLEILE